MLIYHYSKIHSFMYLSQEKDKVGSICQRRDLRRHSVVRWSLWWREPISPTQGSATFGLSQFISSRFPQGLMYWKDDGAAQADVTC